MPPLRTFMQSTRTQVMRWKALLPAICILCSCSQSDTVLIEPKAGADDLESMLLNDALNRLSPEERKVFDKVGGVRGFIFHGQKLRCVVIVTVRQDVMKNIADPAFCYQKKTNHYAGRL